MSDLLAAVGQVFTSAMTMVGTVAGSIAGFTTSEGGVVTFNNPGMIARILRSRG